jgi:hypothetical protein
MKKIQLEQTFPYSLQAVLEAREKRWDDSETFSEISDQKQLDKKQEGDILISRRKLGLSNYLPAIVRKVLPASIMELNDDSSYNIKTNVNTFEIYPEKHKDKFLISGKSNYIGIDETSCKREFEIQVNVNLLLVGGPMEIQVADLYKKNLEKDYKKIINYLEKNS